MWKKFVQKNLVSRSNDNKHGDVFTRPVVFKISNDLGTTKFDSHEKQFSKAQRKEVSISDGWFRLQPCNESVSFFIFPDMQRILASKEYFVRRSQSWCSETAVQHKVCLPSRLVGKNRMKGNSTHSTQRNFTSGEEVRVKSERQGKERNLCDVLPPAVLPPLYSEKNKTLREKRLATLKRKDQDALWEGLEDCRYIRTYFKENWVLTAYSFNLLFIRESCKIL